MSHFRLFTLVVLSIVLFGCSPSGSLAGRVQAWSKGVGFADHVEIIVNDISGIRDELSRGDLKSLPTLCTVLGQDAQKFYVQALPSPSIEINQDLSKALKITYKGAYSCYLDGTKNNTKNLLKDINNISTSLFYYSKAQELVASYEAKVE